MIAVRLTPIASQAERRITRSRLCVDEQRLHAHALEAPAAAEERQLDEEGTAHHQPPGAFDEVADGPSGPATDNSPPSTLNTTRSFSSGLFFEAFAMLICLRQTQTAD